MKIMGPVWGRVEGVEPGLEQDPGMYEEEEA